MPSSVSSFNLMGSWWITTKLNLFCENQGTSNDQFYKLISPSGFYYFTGNPNLSTSEVAQWQKNCQRLQLKTYKPSIKRQPTLVNTLKLLPKGLRDRQQAQSHHLVVKDIEWSKRGKHFFKPWVTHSESMFVILKCVWHVDCFHKFDLVVDSVGNLWSMQID